MDSKRELRVLIVEPSRAPYQIIIKDDLKVLQEIVAGTIEAVYISDTACIICNEMGKLSRLMPNRRVGNSIIVGTFLVVGIREDSEQLHSLNKEDIDLYSNKFKDVEILDKMLNNKPVW